MRLDREETLRVLDGIEYRRVPKDLGPHCLQEWEEVEVFYNGRWLSLCRTDLKDDVATGRNMKDIEDPIGYFKERAKLGARIIKDRFSVIDAFSDG